MAQVSVAMPPQLLPNEPLATICPAASQSTIASTVRASDWNVFSRQSAIVEAEASADEHAGQGHGVGPHDLSRRDPAQQRGQGKQRQRGRQQHQHAQQAGQQPPQHQLAVGQVRQ